MTSFTGYHSLRSVRRQHQTQGAALIIVLAFLVLATILVVAFLSTVANEHGASKLTADSEAARQLADTTVQIVMGQIREATSQPDTAWASQPGMIRTYNAGGQASEVFALYSTSAMRRVLGGAGFDPSVDLPPASWREDKALWMDLNAPSVGRSGQNVFPVIDPRAAGSVGGGDSLVEGFSYDATAVAGAVAPSGVSDDAARLPMPVRWIYILRDGTLTAPSGGGGNVAQFSGPDPVPTAENPIVGRMAFWTDDETCKLNINTACGGVPWDTPLGNSGLEMLFARYQPAKNEFSRYPGHPATVSLAPVLWNFLGMSSADDTLLPAFTPDFDSRNPMKSGPSLTSAGTAFRDKLYPTIPRNTYGGSSMATRPTVDVRDGLSALAKVDSDRLFASVDELLYGPDEANPDRSSNLLGLTRDDISKLGFFLTAHSRAPEVNLFNLPKIGLWPLPDASRKSVYNTNSAAGDTRSPLDRLIAFCTTLSYDNNTKKREYAFTRYDATNAKNDFNATDAFGSKNNQVVYDYLEELFSQPLPGFGGSFQGRYGTDGTRQVLTGVYDFIRSQINVADSSHAASDAQSSQNLDAAFVSRYAYAAKLSGSLAADGLTGDAGQVIPAELPNGTFGGGRFPVVSQVTLEFIARAANQPPTAGNPMHPWVPSGSGVAAYPTMDMETNSIASGYDATKVAGEKLHTHPGLRYLTVSPSGGEPYALPNPRYRGPDLTLYQTQIEPTFLISFSIPAAGIPAIKGGFSVRVKGLQNLTANGSALFPSYDGTVSKIASSLTLMYNVGLSRMAGTLFFQGNPVIVGEVTDFGQTFAFGGGGIEIELINPIDNSVVQTYALQFPAAVFPTPLLPNPLPVDNRARSSNSLWAGTSSKPLFPPIRPADLPPSSMLTFDPTSTLSRVPNFPKGVTDYSGGNSEGGGSAPTEGPTRRTSGVAASFANLILPQWPVGNDYRGKLTSDTVRSLEVAYGDARMVTQFKNVPASFFLPHRFYFDTKMRPAHSLRDVQYETHFEHLQGATLQYLTASSAESGANLPSYGGAWNSSDANPGNLWSVADGKDVQRMPYNYFVAGNQAIATRWPFTASSAEFDPGRFSAYKNSSSTLSGIPDFPSLWQRGGDFSSGIPGMMDGAMLGKPDEGNNRIYNRGIYPYYNELATVSILPAGPNLFAPNRQVPSPVILGSIPSGYKSSFQASAPKLSDVTPWRTLLFSPNPVGVSHESLSEVSRGGNAVQSGKAPDFTLLDFFWMPVVEPYAISEPLSTAGKVNMNVQIAPFTYIKRDAALRGALRSTMLTAIPDKWINNKSTTGSGSALLSDVGGSSASINYANFRYPIDADETLKQFQHRFDDGDIFRSASEICSLWLYPGKRSSGDASGPAWDSGNTALQNWWYSDPGRESKSVTGDNLREKPYAALYPLLTTKSNTFTVHFLVQTLQKVPSTSVSQWVEGSDRVTSEYRGSQTIERYIDPTDAKLVDFASLVGSEMPNLGDYYRFRIIGNKRFSP